MRRVILTAWLVMVISAVGQAGSEEGGAGAVLRQYLSLPNEIAGDHNAARQNRLALLMHLKANPDEAVAAIDAVLPDVREQEKRRELAAFLGDQIQTKAAAETLVALLKDSDDGVRHAAIHGLRRLSGRTHRTGPARWVRREEMPALVDGLVEHLVAAAEDGSEWCRIGALYALADSRDAAGVAGLRKRLSDPSETVRFYAACFLTEYQDVSGLPELLNALHRFCEVELKDLSVEDLDTHNNNAIMLLASLERVTGRSFGKIPMELSLSSSILARDAGQGKIKDLLRIWRDWWAWEPNQ